MESLKKRRGVVKGLVTKMNQYAVSIKKETPYEDIKVRLTKLSELWNNFMEIESEMFELDTGEESDLINFSDTWYACTAEFNKKIRLFHTSTNLTENSPENSTMIGMNNTQVHGADIKLPRLNIPVFSGENYDDFQTFYDLFNGAVHENPNLTPAQKFQHLLSFTSGSARGLIKHFPLTEANYVEAYKKLYERFSRKKVVLNAYIDRFITQKFIHEATGSNIRKLCDTSDEIVRGIKSLGTEAESRDAWLIYIMLSKLDPQTRQLWSDETTNNDFPSLELFFKFLNKRADGLESSLPQNQVNNSKYSFKQTHANQHRNYNQRLQSHTIDYNCPICNIVHNLFMCPKFIEMTPEQRRKFVQESNRCYNCLCSSHQISRCKSKKSCLKCRKRHHSMLHLPASQTPINTTILHSQSQQPQKDDMLTTSHLNQPPHQSQPSNYHQRLSSFQQSQPTTQSTYSIPSTSNCNNVSSLQSNITQRKTILPTAVVYIKGFDNQLHTCRALLDSGSHASFISESCVQRLGIPRTNADLQLTGIAGAQAGSIRGKVFVDVYSKYNVCDADVISIDALILTKITANQPPTYIQPTTFDEFFKLNLADPLFYKSQPIDLLIGIDYFLYVLQDGRISNEVDRPVAINTMFGWVVGGQIATNMNKVQSLCVNNDINYTLQKFWLVEEMLNPKPISPDDEFSEKFFLQHCHRLPSGRYQLNLPFKNTDINLGESRTQAVHRLKAMERKLSRNPSLYQQYHDFMDEYLQMGHMQIILPTEKIPSPPNCFYLPHHAIIKQSSTTTKLRVVFDGSAKSSSSISLNQELVVGPTLQKPLHTILLRFRRHRYAITSDIEKMYRQIQIHPDDTNFQRIVWRKAENERIQDYRLLTLTYGTSPAPFLAVRTLIKLADDEQNVYPRACEILRNDFYMDDLMSGGDSIEETQQLCHDLIRLLQSGGFLLRKWTANNEQILKDVPAENREMKPLQINDENQFIKILGLEWNPNDDYFSFHVSFNTQPVLTKRGMLSESSRIFDPLGLIAPSIIWVKIQFQQLWIAKIDWDEELPTNITEKWLLFRRESHRFSKLQIPRWLRRVGDKQLHNFSDASQQAYAAVIYFRSEDNNGNINLTIVTSKTKVAPLKPMTIVKLELCAALLLTRLMKSVEESLEYHNVETFLWTDSKTVLAYLSSHPSRWATFVANRTAEILQSYPRQKWNYISTMDNPADCASRGLLPSELVKHTLWWNGPTLLRQSSINWKTEIELPTAEDLNLEMRTTNHNTNIHVPNPLIIELLKTFSRFSKLVRVFSMCLKFIDLCSKNRQKKS